MEKVISNSNIRVLKAKFVNGVFKPLESVKGIKENEIISIEIKPDLNNWQGILKNVQLSSVELQHKINRMWK